MVASLCRLAEQVAAARRDGPDRQGHRAGAAVREIPARPKAAAVCPVGPRVAVMRAAYVAPPEAVRQVAAAHSAAVPAVQRGVVERPVAAVVVGSQAVPRVVAVASPDEPPAVAAAEPDVQRAVLAVRDGGRRWCRWRRRCRFCRRRWRRWRSRFGRWWRRRSRLFLRVFGGLFLLFFDLRRCQRRRGGLREQLGFFLRTSLDGSDRRIRRCSQSRRNGQSGAHGRTGQQKRFNRIHRQNSPDGGRLHLSSAFLLGIISSDFRAPRLRAGHPGDRALTFAHDKCSASELRLNDIRRFCVGGPAFCNCCPATLIFAEIAANLHGGARFVDE